MRWASSRETSSRSRPSWRAPHEALVLICSGRTKGTAGPVALVVGTLLSAVNEGSVIVGGDVTGTTAIRVATNYTVPYLVASIGYLTACRIPRDTEKHDDAT